MKPEEQRIAIAEACGWAQDGPWGNHWIDPSGRAHEIWGPGLACPDYLNNLNAMHEAENAVIWPRRLWYQYCLKLPGRSFDESIGATAAQRAEAFLRTLNLWKP
jgi:hypothetical protein